MTIREICESFNIVGKYVGCEELSTGNINSTYKVHYVTDNQEKNYIIQRINKSVFASPVRVMENIVKVTEHVREKVEQLNLPTRRFALRAFLTKDGKKPYFIDEFGEYWRCYRFINNSVTYDSSEDLGIIERVGQAFGRFQNCLSDFDANSLFVIIPNFHNTIKRFESFKKAISEDAYNRLDKVKAEVDELLSFEKSACELQGYLDRGEIPLRVTHNDTKCNNVSFDKTTGEALAVLDLDTVMPGAIAHDFGDAIRFIANTLVEDDPRIHLVSIDLDKYTAFTKGFIGQLKDSLTDLEKKTMNLGVLTITVELAVRFMTDYLTGDKYFKVKYPGHNIDRVHNQLALARDFMKKRDALELIIQKYF